MASSSNAVTVTIGSDASSDDDNYYQNIVNNTILNQKKKKRTKRPKTEIPDLFRAQPLRERPPVSTTTVPKEKPNLKRINPSVNYTVDSDLDSDSDGEFEIQDPVRRLAMRAKRACEEDKRREEQELYEIERMARVADAQPGARPQNYVCVPALEEAETNLRRCAQLNDAYENVQTLVASPPVRRESLDNSYNENEEDSVDLVVKDLENPDRRGKAIIWLASKPMRELREQMAADWGCSPSLVTLTIDGICVEDTATPDTLKLKKNRVTILSAFRVAETQSAARGVSEPPADPNILKIKCQQANKRAVVIEMHKDTKFSEVKKLVMEKLGLTSLARLLFDSEEVEDDQSLDDAGMETEDCLDIYV